MTIRSYSNGPRTAVEAISAGYLCGIASGQVDLLDDSGQTTVVTVAPLGVAATDAAANGEIAVVDFGEVDIIAGTGGLTQGQSFVAEAATGKALPFAKATYTDGQEVWIVGRALEAISANALGRAFVQPQLITISKP